MLENGKPGEVSLNFSMAAKDQSNHQEADVFSSSKKEKMFSNKFVFPMFF